ncbi:Nuclear hormone receptor family member nhr-27 [Caenorhabditis elegans]|nr:Nuclear hormone receptor family member nhr-27 [Caenorhabditis elegans]CAA90294.1 Nuclear hormone receptor family member nhr-27 [Caenorhabditis elegans]|eukprot:NP_001257198.1 Nuclear Hormone Receptor family [Caenorhabditis elegans]
MSTYVSNCVVCGRLTSLFNYGAHSCSACGSFLRRTLASSKFLDDCKYSGNCFENFKRAIHFECKFCRLHKCVQKGMLDLSRYTHLERLICELSEFDSKRETLFLTMTVSNGFKAEELMWQSSVSLVKKPPHLVFNSHDWGFMNQVTIIDFLKKLEFSKFLSSQDLRSFLKCTHFTQVILKSAVISYNANQNYMSFPNKIDIFPETVTEGTSISVNLQNRIRCRLVNRLIELKVTHEEMLLLCAIAFSNPAIPELSENGRTLLNSYQNVYRSALFQYCSTAYQRNGPSRFNDLLFLLHVVTKTHDDIKKYFTLFQFFQPTEQPSQVHQDVIEFIN